MSRLNAAVIAALLLATTACSGGMLPDREPHIVGGWLMVDSDGTSNLDETEQHVTFGPDGSFHVLFRFLGFQAGLGAGEWRRGEYRLDGNELSIRMDPPEGLDPVYAPAPAWEDQGTVRVQGDYLMLTLDRPNDPKGATLVYRRSNELRPE